MKTAAMIAACLVGLVLAGVYLVGQSLPALAASAVLLVLTYWLAGTPRKRDVTTRTRLCNAAFACCLIGLWAILTTQRVTPRVFHVIGSSMAPAIHDGDVVAGDDASRIDRGDIIVYVREGRHNVARVLGLPLDSVTIRSGDVYVNGRMAVENYVASSSRTEDGTVADAVVPIRHYYVLADRRNNGLDSRHVGPIPFEQVASRAGRVYSLSALAPADQLAVAASLCALILCACAVGVLYPFTSRGRNQKFPLVIHVIVTALIAIALLAPNERGTIGSRVVMLSLTYSYGLQATAHALATTYLWLTLSVAVATAAYVRGIARPFGTRRGRTVADADSTRLREEYSKAAAATRQAEADRDRPKERSTDEGARRLQEEYLRAERLRQEAESDRERARQEVRRAEELKRKAEEDWRRLKSQIGNANNPYQVLGCHGSDPMEKIVEIHRRLIQIYHPDRYEGYDFLSKKQKNDLTATINAAFDAIVAERRPGGPAPR